MPTYFRFEFQHIQPPLESSFNRLVCSRIYSLSILNLFIVCSFVQFYPIVVSAWTKVACAFFYCRISVPLGTWTRTTQIKSLVLCHWASDTYGGSLFRRDNEFLTLRLNYLLYLGLLSRHVTKMSVKWAGKDSNLRCFSCAWFTVKCSRRCATYPLPNICLYHH